VVSSLEGVGAVTTVQTLQFVPSESGRNFNGAPFRTDGQAVILWLR
jgi:hypothetical protein